MIPGRAALRAERLQTGDELQICKALPAEEAIYFFNGARRSACQNAQYVILHAIAVEQGDAAADRVKGILTVCVQPIAIVNLGGTVQL